MKLIDIRLISAGILFVLIIVSGIWVSKSGRPINMAIFTIHKLIALACLILLVLIVRILAKGAVITPAVIASIVVTSLCFMIMFGTGAVLSIEKPSPAYFLLLHRIMPVITFGSSVMTVYLLKGH